MAMRKALWDRLGGVDQSYLNGYGDLDFCQRLIQQGGNVFTVPGAVVMHWERSTEFGRVGGRKSNLARFWSRWGHQIKDDLVERLVAGVDMLVKASNAAQDPMIGVDLCLDRVGAENLWRQFSETGLLVRSIECLAGRVPVDGSPAWLPVTMGRDAHMAPSRYMFLTENFVQLRENWYWDKARKAVRDDDIVMDLYGNCMFASEITSRSWPGGKLR